MFRYVFLALIRASYPLAAAAAGVRTPQEYEAILQALRPSPDV